MPDVVSLCRLWNEQALCRDMDTAPVLRDGYADTVSPASCCNISISIGVRVAHPVVTV